jgi:ribosomal protein L11 methylase PrmA
MSSIDTVAENRIHKQDDAMDKEEIIDDWQLDMNFHVFSKHTLQTISAHDTLVHLECVEQLTPVDMMNLANGEHDATGHCVWMGAFLLLDALGVLLEDCFTGKRILELGCGTGIGGLGLMCAHDKERRPSSVLLTDADPDALQVCQRNCQQHNQLLENTYRIQELTWGEPLSPETLNASFDTTLATDVLYDIALLRPLFQTAHSALKASGLFVLSHVPRACYSSQHPPVDDLDQYIVDQAAQNGFLLQRHIFPNQLPKEFRSTRSLNESISLNDMQEVGASLFVFRKAPNR